MNGLSFGAAASEPDSYYREMVRAIQNSPPGYSPPTRLTVSGPLLEKCDAELANNIAKRDENGVVSRKYGATHISDGWDSTDNLPLINSAFIIANDGGVYHRSSGHQWAHETRGVLRRLDD